MKTNDGQIEIEKGKEEKKTIKDKSTSATPTSATQERRRQHARGIRILQARKERGGGVAPRRNNRTEEQNPPPRKKIRGAKVKAKNVMECAIRLWIKDR